MYTQTKDNNITLTVWWKGPPSVGGGCDKMGGLSISKINLIFKNSKDSFQIAPPEKPIFYKEGEQLMIREFAPSSKVAIERSFIKIPFENLNNLAIEVHYLERSFKKVPSASPIEMGYQEYERESQQIFPVAAPDAVDGKKYHLLITIPFPCPRLTPTASIKKKM